jgi:hypothetical protein
MMSSTKHKSKQRRGRRLARAQETRRRKNAYMLALRRFAYRLGLGEIYETHIAHRRRVLEYLTVLAPRIDAAPGCGISSRMLKRLRAEFAALLATTELPGGASAYEVATVGVTLVMAGFDIEKSAPEAGAAISEKMEPLLELVTPRAAAFQRIQNRLLGFAVRRSGIDRGCLWFELQKPESLKRLLAFTIRRREPVRRRVTLDGGARPVYRVVMPLHCSIVWEASIPAEALKEYVAYDQPHVPLYVQSHALHRLHQRLAPLEPCDCDFYLAAATLSPRIVRTEAGTLMLGVWAGEQALGYLVLEPLKRMLVGRTFLFITQTGAPEGDALARLLSIMPAERRYLGLDKLETFLATDILHDPALFFVFEQCGLANMLDMQEIFNRGTIEPYAERLRAYLRIDECLVDEESGEIEESKENEASYVRCETLRAAGRGAEPAKALSA